MGKELRHGGNTDAAERAFGTPAKGWLDLSTGINPVAYPVSAIPTDIWQRLPIKRDETRLIDAARSYYRIPDSAGLIFAPGTQAIIQWLPVSPAPCRVQVLGPTYEEHVARWHACGHRVEIIEDLSIADADVVIVVNPNNPDGRTIPPDTLLDLADHQAERNGMLIVDEAFADVHPGISVAAACGRPGLLVLRSFGKFFGLAGIRLGFAAGTPEDTGLLRDALGNWSVAGPALSIGARALCDTDWHAETLARLNRDSQRLDQILIRTGLEIVGGTALYRLARTEDAPLIYETLGRAGIMVRKFDNESSWLRFGLPGDDDGWSRLEATLKQDISSP
ncbi:MAG: threonine-phosphate decarboxylase CobD [Rhodospirillales bacterium]